MKIPIILAHQGAKSSNYTIPIMIMNQLVFSRSEVFIENLILANVHAENTWMIMIARHWIDPLRASMFSALLLDVFDCGIKMSTVLVLICENTDYWPRLGQQIAIYYNIYDTALCCINFSDLPSIMNYFVKFHANTSIPGESLIVG